MCEPINSHYQIEGKGIAVFFIHAMTASHKAWDGVTAQLKTDFKCISYDLRGHGESGMPKASCSLEDLVTDLELLRLRLGIERAHIVGHSLGGTIAAAYARAYPDRVISLSMLSTSAGRTADDQAQISTVINKLEQYGVSAIIDSLVQRWYTPEFVDSNANMVNARVQATLEFDADIFTNMFRIYGLTEMGPWLPDIKMPTLVLTGECDTRCNPRHNRFIADQIPNSELVILEKLRHAILYEAPEQVAFHLKRFLRSHDEAEQA